MIRYSAKSRFKEFGDEGDSIIQLWRASKRTQPAALEPCSIIMRQEEPDCVRFFIEEKVNSEKKSLSFVKFEHLARRVGLSGRLGPTSTREIPPDIAASIKGNWPK